MGEEREKGEYGIGGREEVDSGMRRRMRVG